MVIKGSNIVSLDKEFDRVGEVLLPSIINTNNYNQYFNTICFQAVDGFEMEKGDLDELTLDLVNFISDIQDKYNINLLSNDSIDI